MKVLFATSELWPLIKTGGLGDVSYSLPHALSRHGADVRVVMPAYREVLRQVEHCRILGWLREGIEDYAHPVRILEVKHKQFTLPLILVDCANLFDREGNPYMHPEGYDWPDNAERFTLFARAVAHLAIGRLGGGWKPDVVHSNDWQTGLVSAFLEHEIERPRRIFTIHNLAYGGHFPHSEFTRLGLPAEWWSADGAEFYGNFSMLKSGIVYSDAITTVSPTYAKEICTPAYGYGMENVLAARSYKLSGILNGIDMDTWNPESDPYLSTHYSIKEINSGKQANKEALLKEFGAKITKKLLAAPLLGMVSRLVEQKGVDLVLNIIPYLLQKTSANFIIAGSGNAHYEAHLHQLAADNPQRVFVYTGYSESRAHLLEAGSDIFLMPSRYEPCGLNQMYSLRYGTLPIVNLTGGLADTVIDATAKNIANDTATGFVFQDGLLTGLEEAILRALSIYAKPEQWQQLQQTAMQQDFSWDQSARKYLQLYREGKRA